MRKFFSHPIVATSVKLLVSTVLLGGLVYYIDGAAVMLSLRNANAFFLSIGFMLAALQLVVHFYRWRYLLRLISKEITNEEVITSLFVGFMAGFFTPAQLGEVAGRIASHPTVNKSHVIGITIIDKLYWAALTFIIGGTGLLVFASIHFTEFWHPYYSIIVICVLVLIGVVYLLPEKVKILLKRLPEKIRLHRFYEIILVIENKFHNNNARVLFALTALLYAVILSEFYFLAAAFGTVSLADALMCAASVFFVKAVILPISFGDLGVRESAAVFFFEKAGASAAVAFNASITMSFANVIVPTAIGALLVMRLKRK